MFKRVTTVGSWCLYMAVESFFDNDMQLLYGDTDSCFIAATVLTERLYGGAVKDHAATCVETLHRRLGATPLTGMKMTIENLHKGIPTNRRQEARVQFGKQQPRRPETRRQRRPVMYDAAGLAIAVRI